MSECGSERKPTKNNKKHMTDLFFHVDSSMFVTKSVILNVLDFPGFQGLWLFACTFVKISCGKSSASQSEINGRSLFLKLDSRNTSARFLKLDVIITEVYG